MLAGPHPRSLFARRLRASLKPQTLLNTRGAPPPLDFLGDLAPRSSRRRYLMLAGPHPRSISSAPGRLPKAAGAADCATGLKPLHPSTALRSLDATALGRTTSVVRDRRD